MQYKGNADLRPKQGAAARNAAAFFLCVMKLLLTEYSCGGQEVTDKLIQLMQIRRYQTS